jgi:hypothetical protein
LDRSRHERVLAQGFVQANLPTPLVGLWERINISVFLVWVVVLAIVLLRGASSKEVS